MTSAPLTLATPPVRTLHDTLEEQLTLHGHLLSVAHREEAAIVAGDVEALTALVEEQEQLLELLASLETERMTATIAIAAALGLHPDHTPRLAELADGLDATAAQTVIGTGQALRDRAVALSEANARNTALLAGSHALIERWIGYLRSLVGTTLGYSPDGAARAPGSARVIDRSA